MKKFVCALTVVMLLTSILVYSSQAWEITPFYTHTEEIAADLSVSGGTATCAGRLVLKSSNHSGSVIVRLQQKNGNNWMAFGYWGGTSSPPGKIAFASGTKALVHGYTYRVVVIGKIIDSAGNVLETVSEYSSEVNY